MLLVYVVDHSQQALEVHHTLAELDVTFGRDAWGVLDVKEGITRSVLLHVFERVLATDRGVAGVELQRNDGWIRTLNKNVVRCRSVHVAEVPRFIVEPDANTAAQRPRSRFVEAIRPASIVIE